MKPPYRFSAALLLFLTVLSASHSQVVFDTVSIRSVGPGVTHYRVIAPGVPWNINVLKIDLRNAALSLETVKASDRLAGHEIVSSMARRKSSPGHDAIAAINGDFYGGDGTPTTIQIAQGQILRNPVARPALGFDVNNAPIMDVVTLGAALILADTVATIHGVNATRQTDQLILFNSFRGAATGTNQYGTEAVLRPLNPWLVNDTISCVVESIQVRVGNMVIPQGGAVLSGHGTSESQVMSRLQTGDTVRIYQRISPGPLKLKEMIGGYPKLVVGGKDVSYDAPREPRTAAGFSADSSILYLLTVDGRQTFSVGMTFTELAQYMIGIGVSTGINLDGGGSTTMVIRDSVMNSPSDGGERAVSNGLLLISSSQTGTLSKVSISPRNSRIFRGGVKTYTAFGADQDGNPVALDPTVARFSCDHSIGTIDSLTGIFTASQPGGRGFVKLRYGSYIDSAHVFVKPVATVILAPRDVVTDSTRAITLVPTSYDSDGLRQTIPVDAFQWSLTNPAIGSITDQGVFKGRIAGTTGVVAFVDGVSDTAMIRVEFGEGYGTLDSLENQSRWIASASLVDSFSVAAIDSFSTIGRSALRISYAFTASTDISYVYLDTNIPVFGVPDSVLIDARTENDAHRIYYVIEDDNGEQFRLYSSRLMNKVGTVDTIRAPLTPSQAITSGAIFNYPITIKRIEIQLVYSRKVGTRYSGVLYLDNLRVSYLKKATVSVEEYSSPSPPEFQLHQNYPNPFNPSTNVEFRLPIGGMVKLSIYDLLGREVVVLVNEEKPAGTYSVKWEASGMASGIYFYTLQTGNIRDTRRMILLR